MKAKWVGLSVIAVVAVVAALMLSNAVSIAQDSHENMASPATASAPASAPASAGKVVNTKCPIMGGKVDPATISDDLTREYKGQKVGFCCPMCPPVWDKLSDADKAKKLAAVMKAAPAGK